MSLAGEAAGLGIENASKQCCGGSGPISSAPMPPFSYILHTNITLWVCGSEAVIVSRSNA